MSIGNFSRRLESDPSPIQEFLQAPRRERENSVQGRLGDPGPAEQRGGLAEGGKLFGSADEGQTWARLADGLPPILAVKTALA